VSLLVVRREARDQGPPARSPLLHEWGRGPGPDTCDGTDRVSCRAGRSRVGRGLRWRPPPN